MENYITKEGLEKLKKEVEYLKKDKRKQVGERIRAAAAMGDLSENFEYSSAKEEQEFVERKIAGLEDIISTAKIIQESSQSSSVQVGSNVMLQIGGEKMTVTITGAQEANPLEGKISAESPLGSVLLGKKKGEVVKVTTPGGEVSYKVLEIG